MPRRPHGTLQRRLTDHAMRDNLPKGMIALLIALSVVLAMPTTTLAQSVRSGTVLNGTEIVVASLGVLGWDC